MKKITYTIKSETGLHARPAGLLTKQAAAFKSNIKILNRESGNEADVKRLMAVMALGVKQGNSVEISVDGEDEQEAISSIEDFLNNHLI